MLTPPYPGVTRSRAKSAPHAVGHSHEVGRHTIYLIPHAALERGDGYTGQRSETHLPRDSGLGQRRGSIGGDGAPLESVPLVRIEGTRASGAEGRDLDGRADCRYNWTRREKRIVVVISREVPNLARRKTRESTDGRLRNRLGIRVMGIPAIHRSTHDLAGRGVHEPV